MVLGGEYSWGGSLGTVVGLLKRAVRCHKRAGSATLRVGTLRDAKWLETHKKTDVWTRASPCPLTQTSFPYSLCPS